MAHRGTLRTWHADRGYGFIAPTDGGRELFVHLSAFPRDGSRPAVGESLTYELGVGKDGRPQAVRVVRQALGRPVDYPRRARRPAARRSPVVAIVLGLLVAVGLGALGYSRYSPRTASPLIAPADANAADPAPTQKREAAYRCDGRTHCAQMTSCAEATFFLKNCPGTVMDGDYDGVPCEQQWCTSPFSK